MKHAYIPLILTCSLCGLSACKEKPQLNSAPVSKNTTEISTQEQNTHIETPEEVKKRKQEAEKKQRQAAATILEQAIEINRKEIFTLEDAKAKGVEIKCSKEDAQLLLHIIINHDERDENGNLCWGSNTIGTALVACVMLGIAAELDSEICELVFATLTEHATKIEPKLLDELLDRITKTDIKNLNSKLNALAEKLAPKEHADILTIIWSFKIRVASMEDASAVIALFQTESLDRNLLAALCAYTVRLIKNTDNEEEKAALVKLIWDTVKGDEDKLGDKSIMHLLAYTCQPDALAYYKGKMEDKKNWKKYCPFFAAWHSDDIAAYLCELRSTCGPDEEKQADIIDMTIMRVLTQDRERSAEEAILFLTMAYDDFFADTSALQELIEKDETRTPEEEEEYQRLKKVVKRQTQVVEYLGNCCNTYYDWVDAVLNKIDEECNKANSYLHRKLSNAVKKARKKIQENETRMNQIRN